MRYLWISLTCAAALLTGVFLGRYHAAPSAGKAAAGSAARPGVPKAQASPPPDLVTKIVFAQRLSISVRTVEKMLADQTIPYVRLGRKCLRIPWSEAMAHLRRNYTINAR